MRRAVSEASLITMPPKTPSFIPPARYAAAVASKLGALDPLGFGGSAMWNWAAAHAAAAAAADEQVRGWGVELTCESYR
jgi:hypothetical protein